MSDTSHMLADCQKWYGDERGLALYNRHRDTLHRIFANPTEIKVTREKPICLDCGSENIGRKPHD